MAANPTKKHKHGNRSIEVCHWNLRAKKWEYKVTEIQALVDEMKPDFCFISEANLAANTPEYLTNIMGYDLICPKSHKSEKFSRFVLLAKEGAQYTVDLKRISNEIASIWINVGGKRTQSFPCGQSIQGADSTKLPSSEQS